MRFWRDAVNWRKHLQSREDDLQRELRADLELEAEERRDAGMPPGEAREAAQRAFGNTVGVAEEVRGMWISTWLANLMQDWRYGLRQFRRSPGFTAAAILMLALGIGANTAIFTLVNEVMLKPLPVANPGQLYRLGQNQTCCVLDGLQGNFTEYSTNLYQHLKVQTQEFTELAAFQAGLSSFGVRRSGVVEYFIGEFVSGNYFQTFGVNAGAGRALTPGDDQPGAPPAAVMSWRAWQARFAQDPSVVGSTFIINGAPVVVVGVAPPSFYGDTLRSDPPDFWVVLSAEPALMHERSVFNHADVHWLYAMGRLPDDVPPGRVQAKLTVELQQWLSNLPTLPASDRQRIPTQRIALFPGRGGVDRMRTYYGDGLRLLVIVSGLVLLMACANVANLLLARGAASRMSTAVRVALGASQTRLIRQKLAESVLLSLLGGIAGVGVAVAGTRAILAVAFRGAIYVPIDPSPSLPILAFAMAVSLLTGAIFGAAPAWFASRADPADSLRGTARSVGDSSGLSRKSLIAVQAALSVVLLVGAGLLTESLRRIEHQNFGFVAQSRLIVRLDPFASYTRERLPALYQQIQQRLSALPGVMSVSYSLYSPMGGGNWDNPIYVEGRPTSSNPSEDSASWLRVSSHYFETIGTRMVRGRAIDERDTPTAPHVAVISEGLAREFFPHQDPLGRHLGLGDASHGHDYEIVGIAEDAKYYDARALPYPTLFLPMLQDVTYASPLDAATQLRSNYAQVVELRVAGRPESFQADVRKALADIDPNLTVPNMTAFDEIVARNFTRERLIGRLTMLYGLLALVLAAVGLYGVAAFYVAERTSEIGVRMALGAQRGSIVAMILRQALAPIAAGLAVGVPLALAGGRAIASQLYGVKGYDPLIFGAAIGVLLLAAVLAGVLPARRAASIDPVRALRGE